jgi:hypothetical protein
MIIGILFMVLSVTYCLESCHAIIVYLECKMLKVKVFMFSYHLDNLLIRILARIQIYSKNSNIV